MAVVYKTSGKTLYEGQVADMTISSEVGFTRWIVTVWNGKTAENFVVYKESEFYPEEKPIVEIDLSNEARKAYEASCLEIEEKVFEKCHKEFKANGYTLADLVKINRAYNKTDKRMNAITSEQANAIYLLLCQKTIRSDFRKSLKAQIDSWLATENPQYPRPLSFKQCKALINASHRI
jgi:hypothetical protein